MAGVSLQAVKEKEVDCGVMSSERWVLVYLCEDFLKLISGNFVMPHDAM